MVDGAYLSTGTGSLYYDAGPFLSNFRCVDGTTFGDMQVNFVASTQDLQMNATGTVNVSFRNLFLGGAGTGTAGGTIRLNETGTTNIIVTGNVNLIPAAVAFTGAGSTARRPRRAG